MSKVIEKFNGNFYLYEDRGENGIYTSSEFEKDSDQYNKLIEQGVEIELISDDVKSELAAEKAAAEKAANDRALKMQGVEFDGVMCSATHKDQSGLLAVARLIEKQGISTMFEFQNGSNLLLSPSNIAEFEAVWTPFRMGFFND